MSNTSQCRTCTCDPKHTRKISKRNKLKNSNVTMSIILSPNILQQAMSLYALFCLVFNLWLFDNSGLTSCLASQTSLSASVPLKDFLISLGNSFSGETLGKKCNQYKEKTRRDIVVEKKGESEIHIGFMPTPKLSNEYCTHPQVYQERFTSERLQRAE